MHMMTWHVLGFKTPEVLQASRGAFLHLFASEARAMLDRISGKTPCTTIHNELPKEEKKSSPDQEEEVLLAKSQPLQSQDLAINPEPSIS